MGGGAACQLHMALSLLEKVPNMLWLAWTDWLEVELLGVIGELRMHTRYVCKIPG
jgi:hypothetical protein